MNNYKFGNYICKLREEKNMTQSELAKELDVSDKAVSKWENGQAIPRMDTFEKLAETLSTTIDDILSASKDGVHRICVVNNYCSLMTLDINGQIFNIKKDEHRWIETTENDLILKIAGDNISDYNFEESEKGILKIKKSFEFVGFDAREKISEHMANSHLQVNCIYKLTDVKPDSVINVEPDIINLGYKIISDFPFLIAYPEIVCDCEKTELIQAKGKNSEEITERFMQYCSALSFSGFRVDFVLHPIRKLYFRHLCKPHILKKNILKADYYHANHNKNNKEKHIKKAKLFSIILLFLLSFIYAFFIKPIIFIEKEKPALVTADHSTIIFYEDVYTRIDALPENIDTEDSMGWKSARTDGLPRIKQFFENNEVTQYTDDNGNAYLWLVEDFPWSWSESPRYNDYRVHYVYMCENPEKSLN